jgi:uncharacterized delta-60 repeat protein
MRGSILVTFDELIDDRGVDNWQLEIGPGTDQLRNVHFTDCNNLYSTFVFTGNTVTFAIVHTDEFRGSVDITRIDYTTDDEGGDLGIKETIITPTITSGTTFYVASFTASTVVSAYNFKYVINASTYRCLSIGSGFNGTYLSDMVLQPDQKLLVSGIFTEYSGSSVDNLIRLNTDGTRDTTFTLPPTLLSTSVYEGISLQSDGKIILGVDPTYGVIRLNTNGTFDNTFFSGLTNNSVQVTKVQSDEKIIVGGNFTTYSGQSYNKIVRLNSNGTIDNTFVIGSGFDLNIFDIDIQSDGKILVAGSFTTYSGQSYNNLIRLNTDGSIDTTFVIGTGFNNSVTDVNVLPDGKILCGGRYSNYNGTLANDIIRLNSDGSIDNTFVSGTGFSGGFGGFGSIFAMATQPDGKTLLGGYFTSYQGQSYNRIIRLNTDGSIDNTFIVGSGFTQTPSDTDTAIFDITLTANGEIYVVGRYNRYDGSTVNNFIKLSSTGKNLIC